MGGGVYVITGANEAGIRATLDTFAVRQATNSDADITVTARARTVDGGAAASSDGVGTLAITVNAVADAPTVTTATRSGNEDTTITFGTGITPVKPDNDGSEGILAVEIGAFPSASWLVAWTNQPNVTVSGAGAGPYTVAITDKAFEASLLSVLASFRVTPPPNSDADATVTVRARTLDNDGSLSAWGATSNITVQVNPVSDTPTLSNSGPLAVEEDTLITFGTAITWVKPDNDGSERVSRVELSGLPTGAARR